MAIVQKQLYDWKQLGDLGELERLQLVLQYMPDEALMRHLEEERGKGRDKYPVRAMWNSILAGIVFGHPSIESLRRDLKRNPVVRELCGFGVEGVPEAWVYTRFLRKLMKHEEEIQGMFDELVEALRKVLPGFGETIWGDGKIIEAHGRPRKEGEGEVARDGRRELDADWVVYRSREKKEPGEEGKGEGKGKGRVKGKGKAEEGEGTLWERVTYKFGFKVHMLVEANYELPIAFEVTPASAPEIKEVHKLLDEVNERHPEVVEACEYFVYDKAADETELLVELWEDHGIKPVIPVRDLWEGDKTRVVKGQVDVVYSEGGEVSCYPRAKQQTTEAEPCRMAYGGLEADRGTLTYRCPAKAYGIECVRKDRCGVKGAIRIRLAEDRRVFVPLPRSSYAWERVSRKRTASERVNSRLDRVFGFEEHFILGRKKMKLRVGLAMLVMLAMALGRVKESQAEKLRSLVQAA